MPRPLGEAPAVDLDTRKERIFRELQRPATTPVEDVNEDESAGIKTETIPYSHMDLLRQAAFGGCIGSITGAVFGFMDGMRTAGESPVLQKASNIAKGRYLMQGTTRSATIFGLFFGGFHMTKYGFRVAMNPGEYTEIALAAPLTVSALMVRPATRAAVPYAAMLIFMDACNMYMRKVD